MKHPLPPLKWLTPAALLLHAPFALAYSTVNFTVSADFASDPGTTFNHFREGEKGTGDVYAVAFTTSISAIDGQAVSPGPIASFCTELQEDIGLSSYQFESHPLAEVSAGRAGQSGTASIGIPIGGIGALRAARVRYLFDQHYESNTISLWNNTESHPTTAAFQIALWEVTHDNDLSLSLATGSTCAGTQNTLRATAALDLASTWISNLANAGITESYTSSIYNVWTLVSLGGNAGFGFQDVLFATSIADSRNPTFQTMSSVPEPSVSLLLLPGCALWGRRRKRPGFLPAQPALM
jgi:hypothetical protein